MDALVRKMAPQLATAPVDLALLLPGGRRLGPAQAQVNLRFSGWPGVAALAAGRVGQVAEDIVEGRTELQGSMRAVMAAAAHLLPGSPVHAGPGAGVWARLRSWLGHTRARDARQIRFHYDVGDEFYALWLDPRRVYSCAYFEHPDMGLAQAQEAKLDLICRKLMLRPGERFLDIGAGWGGLLLWAAEHYGVQAHGITLSRQQFAHVNRLIAARGLQGRVRMELRDYRDLNLAQGFDRIASVGMFEHVGRAHLPGYFTQIRRLLRPGGLVLNHGITAGGLDNAELGSGIGAFIDRYIFPGGELVHGSRVLRALAQGGLEMLDAENLRPHYARTLWAWSDALEAHLPEARAALTRPHGAAQAEKLLRAYRLYLAGCALGFEQGWLALHQVLASRTDGKTHSGPLPGAQSDYPFQRGYMYPAH
jgi:cyclopropane-fatty-acyl-phospholipid synthase